jgi:hypothetical protein
MPAGSKYQGPPEALELFTHAVTDSGIDSEVKGAKNPYASRNGHMISFLSIDGMMALRLSDELREEFLSEYNSGPVIQYGSVMRGYIFVPDELLRITDELTVWFAKSYNWIGTLEPKSTRK